MVQERKHINKARDALKDCLKTIEELDKENPMLAKEYFERYEKACQSAGIRNDENSLIKYLDGPLPFDLETI